MCTFICVEEENETVNFLVFLLKTSYQLKTGGLCTDQLIGCDDVDKRKVGGQEVNVVAVCRSGILQYK